MKRLSFNCIEEFCTKVDADYNALTDDYKNLSIICKYDAAVEIVKTLLCFDYNIRSISELSDPEFNFYTEEYVISLTCIDSDRELWCEPMLRDNGYINVEATATYIFDDCSSQCLAHCDAPLKYEVCIEDECEDCECDGECLDCNLEECDCYDEYGSEDDIANTYTIKVNLDTREAEEVINMIEKRFAKMNGEFERMFSWGKLLW